MTKVSFSTLDQIQKTRYKYTNIRYKWNIRRNKWTSLNIFKEKQQKRDMFCQLIQMAHGLWPYNITAQTQICKGAVHQQHPWVLMTMWWNVVQRQEYVHTHRFGAICSSSFLFCSVFPQRAQFFPFFYSAIFTDISGLLSVLISPSSFTAFLLQMSQKFKG